MSTTISDADRARRPLPPSSANARPLRLDRTLPRTFRTWLLNGSTRPLFRSPWFWVAAALKLVAGSMLASYYMRDLFVPFVNYFAESRLSNPWQHFAAAGRLNAFPYPPVMLYIESIPRILFGHFVAPGVDTVTWVHLLLLRLPLLVCDTVIVVTLCHWFPGRSARLLKYYWWSPIVFYVAYWHGQLDLIPTALFVVALHQIRLRRFTTGMAVFGLALASKTHLLVALPFLVVYVAQELKWRDAMRAVLVGILTYFALLVPFVFQPAFLRMVFATEEQARLFAFQLPIGANGMVILVAPAAILLLWFRFVAYRPRNWDLLMLYFGILFSVFILLVPAAPGYVIWSLPFLVHFLCRGRRSDSAPFLCYSLAYLAFFFCRGGSDIFDAFRVISPHLAALPSPYVLAQRLDPMAAILLEKITYTVMQASLAGTILFMYVVGVRRNDAYNAPTSPIMIGVAGDSGAGKDFFTGLAKEVLGDERVTVIAGDDYHRWPRGHQMWQVYTHLDVRANKLYEQHEHAIAFSRGKSVLKGSYDHRTGQFTEETIVDPNEIMIFQGLHALSIEGLRQMYHLRVFLDPEEDLRFFWKVRRDALDRGHQPPDVIRALQGRSRDRDSFVLPQIDQADLVVRWKTREPIDPADLGAQPACRLEILALNSFDLEALAAELRACDSLAVEHAPYRDSRWQSLCVSGNIQAGVLSAMARRFTDLPAHRSVAIRDGLPGCVQLVFLRCLAQKLRWNGNAYASAL